MNRLLAFAAVLLLPSSLKAQRPLSSPIVRVAERVARPYPMDSTVQYGRDSILLVFLDSTLTAERSEAGTWMFGPPATKAEADGCPPEKVLGRRIAREVWAALGKPRDLGQVIVRVRGPRVGEESDYTQTEWIFYYPLFQLTGPWVGDKRGKTRARRMTQ